MFAAKAQLNIISFQFNSQLKRKNVFTGVPGAGGPWLITDMRRGESVFELDVDVEEAVQMGIAQEGSDLSGVSAKLSWSDQPMVSTEGSGDVLERSEEYPCELHMIGMINDYSNHFS